MENKREIEVNVDEVSCDGEEISKHPLVYLKISKETGKVVCPYCSKTFIYKPSK